jgi:hypothetical protein
MFRRRARRFALSALLTVAAAAHAAEPKPATGVPPVTPEMQAQCGTLSADFGRDGTTLRMVRAGIGPDGKTVVEDRTIEGQVGAFYGGKVRLTQFGLGDPSNVVIVYGHPGIEIPPHPSPYREIFLILSGMAEMLLADGTRLVLTPGTLFLSDDQGGPPRGGRAGPCGYVALDLQFKTAKP